MGIIASIIAIIGEVAADVAAAAAAGGAAADALETVTAVALEEGAAAGAEVGESSILTGDTVNFFGGFDDVGGFEEAGATEEGPIADDAWRWSDAGGRWAYVGAPLAAGVTLVGHVLGMAASGVSVAGNAMQNAEALKPITESYNASFSTGTVIPTWLEGFMSAEEYVEAMQELARQYLDGEVKYDYTLSEATDVAEETHAVLSHRVPEYHPERDPNILFTALQKLKGLSFTFPGAAGSVLTPEALRKWAREEYPDFEEVVSRVTEEEKRRAVFYKELAESKEERLKEIDKEWRKIYERDRAERESGRKLRTKAKDLAGTVAKQAVAAVKEYVRSKVGGIGAELAADIIDGLDKRAEAWAKELVEKGAEWWGGGIAPVKVIVPKNSPRPTADSIPVKNSEDNPPEAKIDGKKYHLVTTKVTVISEKRGRLSHLDLSWYTPGDERFRVAPGADLGYRFKRRLTRDQQRVFGEYLAYKQAGYHINSPLSVPQTLTVAALTLQTAREAAAAPRSRSDAPRKRRVRGTEPRGRGKRRRRD